MQSRPMRYTLRGIPTPASTRGGQPVECEVRILQPIEPEDNPGALIDVPSGGWPGRLRQAFGLGRLFGGR